MDAKTINQTAYHSDLTIASNGKTIYRKDPAKMLLSLAITAAGIALLLLCSRMEDKASALYTVALVFGIAATGTGICMALFGGKQWVYMPTKSKVRTNSFFIEPAQLYAVCQAIEMRDVSHLPELKTLNSSSVRVDMYVSDDGKFAAAQTFQYVPYTYSPVTPVCCAYDEQAKKFSHLF